MTVKRETWRGVRRLGEVSIAGGRVLRAEIVEHIALGRFVELRICQDGTLTNERVRVRINQITPLIKLLSKGTQSEMREAPATGIDARPREPTPALLTDTPTGKAAGIAARLGD